MTRYRVSLDIGGTFTDFVIADEKARCAFTGKILSTPNNPSEGVLAGLRQLVPDPSEISFIVHGTTVGLNAFLERKGARVILITTAGFRDAYSIARGDRRDLYAIQYRKPERLVPRRDVIEVHERLRWDGSVLEPMHEEDFGPIIQQIQVEDIESVAVCFIHSHVNPQHELRARGILREAVPELSVTLSHQVAREWREYERASSAVLNAYIAPVVERYLSILEERMRDQGVRATLHVMQSSGGVTIASAAREHSIQTLLSGPVGGTIGGAALSRIVKRPNLLCVDMGGTSFDVSVVVNGQPGVSTETVLQGLPLLMPLVDIHTIGAGGGSLAWLEAGALRVGPRSAGADPGPACYGRGGTQPTVTDANLFLKRLDPSYFLAGRMDLDEAAAARAIRQMAMKLNLDDVSFAEGILSIINAKMADAIRTITVKQGIDPREFSLVAFGGAGPMHAAWLAQELGITEVVIPWSPGTFSAWGMLQSDVRRDLSRSLYCPLAELDPQAVIAVYWDLEREGRAALCDEGVSPDNVYFTRSADMRYVGQEYAVSVAVGRQIDPREIEASFHEAHRTRHGHATPGAPSEFVNLRVAAMGRLEHDAVGFQGAESGRDPVIGTRSVIFEGVSHDTKVLARRRLGVGACYSGPVLIEEDTATTVVPPGQLARVDGFGNIIITQIHNSGVHDGFC